MKNAPLKAIFSIRFLFREIRHRRGSDDTAKAFWRNKNRRDYQHDCGTIFITPDAVRHFHISSRRMTEKSRRLPLCSASGNFRYTAVVPIFSMPHADGKPRKRFLGGASSLPVEFSAARSNSSVCSREKFIGAYAFSFPKECPLLVFFDRILLLTRNRQKLPEADIFMFRVLALARSRLLNSKKKEGAGSPRSARRSAAYSSSERGRYFWLRKKKPMERRHSRYRSRKGASALAYCLAIEKPPHGFEVDANVSPCRLKPAEPRKSAKSL